MHAPDTTVAIDGWVATGYEALCDTFAANFRRDDDYREVGAALTVYHHGQTVVDIWAGHADRGRQQPWQSNTLINVYSSTKGILATALALLVERGSLNYQERVSRYWPEFAQAGKATITVAQLLSHQAGLSGFVEPTTIDDLYDWELCIDRLSRQAPSQAAGAGTCYHAMTWGFLAGELLRRISGQSAGSFVAEHLCKPLNAEVFIGLPDTCEPRVAEMIGPAQAPDLDNLDVPADAMMALTNPVLDPEVCNRRAWRAAEIPAANGQASARGLARIYALLAGGGSLDDITLLSPATLAQMLAIQSGATDKLLGFSGNWGMGVTFNQSGLLGPAARTFGHGGWGGSLGCANRENNIAIGYVCNRMGAELVGDPRATALCTAAFDAAKKTGVVSSKK